MVIDDIVGIGLCSFNLVLAIIVLRLVIISWLDYRKFSKITNFKKKKK